MTPLRSHVVGSMLRPTDLLDARNRLEAGDLSAADFKRIEDGAVDAAIHEQEHAGINVVTDGEQRRFDYIDALARTVSGLEQLVPAGAAHDTAADDDGFWHRDDPEFQPHAWIPPVITSKLSRIGTLAVEEFAYARARAQRPLKVTLPSPTHALAFWSPDHSAATYPNPRDAVLDFAEILHDEVRQLASLGCEHIQIDAPDLTMLLDDKTAGMYVGMGFSRSGYIDFVCGLLDDVATVAGVTFATHLCRGNKEGEWHSSGGYEAIAAEVFPRLSRYEYLLLEFDDERSGGFEPLQHVRDDQCVVLGLVSTKHDELEHRGALMERIDDAARFHPRDALAISPQCGFASIVYGNPISPEVERAKLELVGAVAREAWA